MLFDPGGAWTTGNKRAGASTDEPPRPLGWICVAINYRLQPRNTWPDHIIGKSARPGVGQGTHQREYGGDPDFIAIAVVRPAALLAALTPKMTHDSTEFEEADAGASSRAFYGV